MKAINRDVDVYAKEMGANWKRFDCFIAWGIDEYQPAENWCLVYVDRGNQSTIIDESNAAEIAKRLDAQPDTDAADGLSDAVPIHSSHWAGGRLSGYMLRIRDDAGELTPKFCEWHSIQCELDDYPILNESDYSDRESEATDRNILTAIDDYARKLERDHGIQSADFPADWRESVSTWIHENEYPENIDDQGGWPDEDSIDSAFLACGLTEEAADAIG